MFQQLLQRHPGSGPLTVEPVKMPNMHLTRRTPAALALALATAAAGAAPPADPAMLRSWLEPQVAEIAAREGFTRYQIDLTPIQARTPLAPCARVEPFLPAGSRPWGRLNVGLRCAEGARWTLMQPVTVSVWGPALVAAGSLAPGAVLSPQDIQEAGEVELTREPPGLLRDPAALLGRTLTRAVPAGQPLRADMVRATLVVQAGDAVRLRIQGSGFSIAASGQAMGAAVDGQAVRVRTDMGKILNGTAREGRIIEVFL
jgi:flagellar basal body P-ring formation protein FlgA